MLTVDFKQLIVCLGVLGFIATCEIIVKIPRSSLVECLQHFFNDFLRKSSNSDVSRAFGRPIYRFRRPKKHFLSWTSTRVVINDFTMRLIISKFLRRQTCRKKRRRDKKTLKWKKKLLTKVFSFKYVIDHANVRFSIWIIYKPTPID